MRIGPVGLLIFLFAPIASAQEGAVTVYDKHYLSQIVNVVTALDLATKIPGGQVILSRNDDNNDRGFANNDDGVLINGKRLSGKNIDSEAALGRISADRVLRIEIIRGSSPDIKISSQESLLNVVLVAEENSGSGTFDIGTRILPGGRLFPLGSVSYSGSAGRVDYFIEAAQSGYITDEFRNDTILNDEQRKIRFISDVGEQYFHDRSLSANIAYRVSETDQLRLNIKTSKSRSSNDWNGQVAEFNPDGESVLNGSSLLQINTDKPGFEAGGDYAGRFSSNWHYKIIGLFSRSNTKTRQVRDALIDAEMPSVDSDTTFESDAVETIFRPSITATLNNVGEIGFGNELSLNRVTAGLDPANMVTVRETRNESFINYSTSLNPQIQFDSEIKFEYSKITQERENGDRSKSFSYLKPSFDLRYKPTKKNQFQFSIRRDVSQLDFNDFASSINDDNTLIGGNRDLVPEKTWMFETSYERKLSNDQGHIKLSLKHERISDHIEFIEVGPNIAGVGNVGTATRNTIGVSTSLKFGFIGLENLVLDGQFEYFDTQTTDAFTDEKRIFNDTEKYVATGILRQDFEKMGLGYSFQFWYYGPTQNKLIDQFIQSDHDRLYISFSINYRIFDGLVLIGSVDNLVNANEDRLRTVYDPNRASGLISFIEDREQFYDKRFRIRLKGSF